MKSSLKSNSANFMLLSYNPGQNPKLFQFRLVQDSCEYKLYNYGDAHTISEQHQNHNLFFDLNRLKREGKVDSLAEILKAGAAPLVQTYQSSHIIDRTVSYGSNRDAFEFREYERNTDAVKQKSSLKPSKPAQQNGIPNRQSSSNSGQQKSQNSRDDSIPGLNDRAYETKEAQNFNSIGLDGFNNLQYETEQLRKNPEMVSSPLLSKILHNQESMMKELQVLMEFIQTNIPRNDRNGSSFHSANQTASIGTNTSMRANELQRYLTEESTQPAHSKALQSESQKIPNGYQERTSMSHQTSGNQKSDKGSKSSNRLRDDAHPSPSDSQSDKMRQNSQMFGLVDESISIRSSGTGNRGEEDDRQLSFSQLGTKKDFSGQSKLISPPFQTDPMRRDYLQPYSPQMQSQNRAFSGRATDGGAGSRHEQPEIRPKMMDPKFDEEREFPKTKSISQGYENKIGQQNKGQHSTTTDKHSGNQMNGLLSQNRLRGTEEVFEIGRYQQEKDSYSHYSSHMDRQGSQTVNDKPGLMENIKQIFKHSEYYPGGGNNTIDVPKALDLSHGKSDQSFSDD